MHALTDSIRQLLARDLPAFEQSLAVAEAALADLERTVRAETIEAREEHYANAVTENSELLEDITDPSVNAVANRAPISVVPPPPRPAWDTVALRRRWDPLHARMRSHVGAERRALYPLALSVLEGRLDQRRALAAPIAQMVAEHEELRQALPAFRRAALAFSPIAPQLQAVAQQFERITRREEVELFPGLLLLADGSFDMTATPLRARYREGPQVSRSLRQARPREVAPATRGVGRFLSWLKRDDD